MLQRLGRWLFCRTSRRSSCNSIEEAIERHTRISREHLTPEISLHLLTPDCPLYTVSLEDTEPVKYFEEPFWSIYWPGGQAVARYILDEGRSFLGGDSRLLDIGAGCGAAAIAARMIGAGDVLANDIDEGTSHYSNQFSANRVRFTAPVDPTHG
ncbi:hypothetical protein TSAR_008709 [Trichomalopsis sarcophagae]|uniref:ETFB lysine methyltransferase n=1 Tax=Trichomalopsis sarcophagae TaxID=543379 RepID=A0A232F5A2_9HYME|nr:hypothetical protein TSAR_008709 [Trichomalopsis sarcophagae]